MSDESTGATKEAIKRRLAEDPEFRAKVEDDPVEALTEAGLPEETLRSFLQEVGIEAEVSGYDFTLNVSHDTSPDRGLPAKPPLGI